jgi:hypothetical protein
VVIREEDVVPKVKGYSLVDEVPKEAGRIVSVVLFNGMLIVACEYRVYQTYGDGDGDTLRPIFFEESAD